jgi:Flp pilus assembly protein TadG
MGRNLMFKRDQSGNVALLFALMLPVLMAAMGGGIEVSRAVEYKQRLTTAVDLACRQAEVYVESITDVTMPSGYTSTIQSYADKNSAERSLTSTAQITASPTVSSVLLTTPPLSVRPGNIHVAAVGSVDLYFKAILNKNSFDFSVVRDCAVTANTSAGPPTMVVSESFEGYSSQLNGGWGVFGSLAKPNCQSAICQNLSWGTTNAGVEVDQLSAIKTGDGVQYGQNFAELDSDCSNRVGAVNANQTTACKQSGTTTNSSINMTMTLSKGVYEVRYVYNARKDVGNYQYPNDNLICSDADDTDGLARNNDVAKNAAGTSTVALDGQTRRIELWIEPKSSGYKSDDQALTASSNPNYMKSYMADVCVWSKLWTERSYKFTVPSTQEYRISWRAAGLDDSFGGLIDYLRVCKNSCP